MTKYLLRVEDRRVRHAEVEVEAESEQEARIRLLDGLPSDFGAAWEEDYSDTEVVWARIVEQPFYIICTERAIEDGAIYTHNKSIAFIGKLIVLICPNKFFADYQLGRLRSGIGWSGSHNVFDTLEAAVEEAKEHSKFF